MFVGGVWGGGVSAGTVHDLNHSCSDLFEPKSEEDGSALSGPLPRIPKDEQVDESGRNSNTSRLPPTKKSKFVKTHSIMLGVDRIDEYSRMDIQTP